MTYDDFTKMELKVAMIVEANLHPNADKLLVLKVSLGSETRQIVAGIRQHYELSSLIGKLIVIVANLEPREVRGQMSHGMLLAASDNGTLSLITSDKPITPGSAIK